MGSFVSLLQHPPQQNFAQAFQDAQLTGLKSALDQQTLDQQRSLAPSIQQQQQAQAQEATLRLAQAQQAQKDQQILAAAMRSAAAPPPDNPAPSSSAPRTVGGNGDDGPAIGEDGADTPTLRGAAAPSASSADLHPSVSARAPGVVPILDSDDIYGRALGISAQNGLSPAGQLQFAQQIMSRKESLSKFKTEDLKQKAEQYDQVAGRGDAFATQPDDYKQQHWTEYLDGLTRDGLMTPTEHQNVLSSYPKYPGDQTFTYLSRMHLADSQLMKRHLNDSEIGQHGAATAASQAETANRQAELPGLKAKADSQQIETFAQQLGAARDQATYDAIRSDMPKKWADELPDAFDPKATPQLIDHWGQTAQQRVASDAVASRNAQTAAHEKVTEQQGTARNTIAQGHLDVAKQKAGTDGKLNGLTPNEWQNKADKLATEGRGYVGTRAQLRTTLAQPYALDRNGNPVPGPGGKPMPMSGAQKAQLQNQVDTVTGRLQDLQWRTAQFLKIPKPPDAAVKQLQDGDQVHSPDGHIWEKRDGILYPVK